MTSNQAYIGANDVQGSSGVLVLPPEFTSVDTQTGHGWMQGLLKDTEEDINKLHLFPIKTWRAFRNGNTWILQ